ncbi:MAG: D-alanyl-D-alanine endopeptidase [Burkholderiaceae bacterium]
MLAVPGSASRVATVRYAPPSIGKAIGLHRVDDPLSLRSSVALVVDAANREVVYQKNASAVLPIASITKLVTAMVVIDSGAAMNEMIVVSQEDVDTERWSSSRLRLGTRLSRREMLQLALMASENRAANALAHAHPAGYAAFIEAMNAKARSVGMESSRFIEPTGLSSSNVSNARDLSRLVLAAAAYPTLARFSTASELTVDTGYRQLTFRNTNSLVDRDDWDIGLQKTGYISEAGRCLVMKAKVGGRPMVMVLLDSTGKYSRFADAKRLRRWLERESPSAHGSKIGPQTLGAPAAPVAAHEG